MISNFGIDFLTPRYYNLLFASPLMDYHHTYAVCFFEVNEIVKGNLSIKKIGIKIGIKIGTATVYFQDGRVARQEIGRVVVVKTAQKIINSRCPYFPYFPKKARSNLRNHKVTFEEAATALSDPMAATGADPDHTISEDRYITFGVSERGRLLAVAHTEEGETVRIISARVASNGERKIYEEG